MKDEITMVLLLIFCLELKQTFVGDTIGKFALVKLFRHDTIIEQTLLYETVGDACLWIMVSVT